MPEIDTSALSLSEAFDVGAENTKDEAPSGSADDHKDSGETPPDSEPDDTPSDLKTGHSNDEPDDKEVEHDDQKSKEEEGDEKKEEEQKDQKPGETKEPVVDPDTGKYEGEFTKERFNGLMAQWQKDRTIALKVPELENKINELTRKLEDPATFQPKPAPGGEFDYPPELAGADEETKRGYQILMKGAATKFITPEKVRDIIKEVLNEPLHEENKIVTKVKQEIETLGAEFGDEFKKNEKDVRKFAVDNEFPLGTLRQAYIVWRSLSEKEKEIARLRGGTKTNQEINEEKKRDAEIPTSGANRRDVIPKFDPTRDGAKSFDEIWDEARQHM